MPSLKIMLMGLFEVFLDEEPVTGFESSKVRALLAYLAAEPGRPARRETLAALLWPDWPDKAALRNLTFALADLRKNIADREAQLPFLLITRASLQLDRASAVWVDLWEFETRIKEQGIRDRGKGVERIDRNPQIDNLQTAMGLYRGPFLDGFSLNDSSPYEEWVLGRREHLNRQVLQALGQLAEWGIEQGEYDLAEGYTRRQIELEAWREQAHRQLMRILSLKGERVQALAQFENLRKALQAELGVEPGVETVALYEQIRDGELDRFPPIPDVHASPGDKPRLHPNLPLQLTHFFGREAEIAQVKDNLVESRLVTLTGSGGVGKTRLALQVVQDIQENYSGRISWVELAQLSDPGLLPQQIAGTLSLRESSITPALDLLIEFLYNKTMLLVFDSCEHMLEACAGLTESLLQACPGVKILTTSREPLGLAGETIFRVPSLPFPERGQVLPPESLDSYASLQLFVDRARQVLPDYQVTSQNMTSLATICQSLDGIPLALELAAARMNLLTAEELSNRLDKAFQVLTGGRRSGLNRHQTLRATIDWSYELLSDKERLLFQRLASFAGEWDLAGVEGVCAGDGLAQEEILDLLGGLLNKSVVMALRASGRQTRYRMLETIRQYAYGKLVRSEELEIMRSRHLLYFMQMAEAMEPDLRGSNQGEWLIRMTTELENFRLALVFARQHDPRAGLRLASALWQFWDKINKPVEGSHWLETYLLMPENSVRDSLRGYALCRACIGANLDPANEGLAREGLQIFNELDDREGQAYAQWALGKSYLGREDYLAARNHYEVAREIYEQNRYLPGLAIIYADLSQVEFYAGDIAAQVVYLEKSLALQRESGNWSEVAWVLDHLEGAAISQGNFVSARAFGDEARSAYYKIYPDRDNAEFNCIRKSYYLIWQGEYLSADQFIENIVERERQTDDETGAPINNCNKGRADCLLGRLEAGSELIERSLRFFRESTRFRYLLKVQQTHILELAYALGCLGKIERARSLVQEFWPIFQAPLYQPLLNKLLGFLDWQQGKTQDALGHYRRSLADAHRMGHRLFAMLALEGYAWTLQQDSQAVRAATLLGAANEFRERIGSPMFPRDRPFQEKVINQLKDCLGEAGFASAWAEGQALGFDQAIADVLGMEEVSPAG